MRAQASAPTSDVPGEGAPAKRRRGRTTVCRERIGGLLRFYHRQAA
jgi:hypothetical protein